MAKSAPALVKPELLVWARDTAGVPVDLAARKVGVKPERLLSWEEGAARPTVAQLRQLADAYKRPFAAFYLPSPPPTPRALRDYRRPDLAARAASAELRLAHRQALHLRQVALALLEETGEVAPPFRLTAELSADPEDVAAELSRELGMAPDERVRWRDEYDAFSAWRSACEDAGVLVLQATAVQPSEMSGFSLDYHPLPVVVVNIKDVAQRRSFTLLHEVVHLAVRRGGLCHMDEASGWEPASQRIEAFCNHAAGAALVPRSDLRGHEIVVRHAGSTWSDVDVGGLASHFRVSREVVLRRLLAAGLTTRSFYSDRREELLREYQATATERKAWGPPPYRRTIARVGRFFVGLVLRAYYQERITASDVAEHLGLRLKHLPKLEEAMFAPPRRP